MNDLSQTNDVLNNSNLSTHHAVVHSFWYNQRKIKLLISGFINNNLKQPFHLELKTIIIQFILITPPNVKLSNVTDKSLLYNNCIYLNPSDIDDFQLEQNSFILINKQQVFELKSDQKLKYGHLGSTALVWRALHLNPKEAVDANVTIEPWNESEYNKNIIAHQIVMMVDTYMKTETVIKSNELNICIQNQFKHQIFCENQSFVIKYTQNDRTYWLNIKIIEMYIDNEQIKFAKFDNNNTHICLEQNITNPFMRLIKASKSYIWWNIHKMKLLTSGVIHRNCHETVPNNIFDVLLVFCVMCQSKSKVKLTQISDLSFLKENHVYLSRMDMKDLHLTEDEYILINQDQVFKLKEDSKLERWQLGVSNLVWKSLSMHEMGGVVNIEPWSESHHVTHKYADHISLEVEIFNKSRVNVNIEVNELANYIRSQFLHQIMCNNQYLIVKCVQMIGCLCNNYHLQLHITRMMDSFETDIKFGKMYESTKIKIQTPHTYTLYLTLIDINNNDESTSMHSKKSLQSVWYNNINVELLISGFIRIYYQDIIPLDICKMLFLYIFTNPTKIKLAKCTSKHLKYNNCVYLSESDMQHLQLIENSLILIDESLVFHIRKDSQLQSGHFGTTSLVWRGLHLSIATAVGTEVTIQPWSEYRDDCTIHSVFIDIDTWSKVPFCLKSDDVKDYIGIHFSNEILCKNQQFIVKWIQKDKVYWIGLHITELLGINDENEKESKQFGVLTKSTSIQLRDVANWYLRLIH